MRARNSSSWTKCWSPPSLSVILPFTLRLDSHWMCLTLRALRPYSTQELGPWTSAIQKGCVLHPCAGVSGVGPFAISRAGAHVVHVGIRPKGRVKFSTQCKPVTSNTHTQRERDERERQPASQNLPPGVTQPQPHQPPSPTGWGRAPYTSCFCRTELLLLFPPPCSTERRRRSPELLCLSFLKFLVPATLTKTFVPM